MKRKWVLVKILFGLILLVSLIIFSQEQYKTRDITEIVAKINYEDGNYFVTEKVIKDILGKTHIDFPEMNMQRVDVQKMEASLLNYPFVKNAEVYIENNGKLHTQISQEKPVIRVNSKQNQYYITSDGKQIPISEYYAAPVLLADGDIDSVEYLPLSQLAEKIYSDKMLKNIIIGVHKRKENSFILVSDDDRYLLNFGNLENIDQKLNNFKVFYKEFIAVTDSMPYKELKLNYINQIVAIK